MAWGQGKGRKSPLIARILSFIIPGLGHCYAIQLGQCFIWFMIATPFILLVYFSYQWEQSLELKLGEYFKYIRSHNFLFSIAPVLYILYLIGCANSAAEAVISYNVRKREMEEKNAK